ncbi:Protein of unknown function [Pyronema omphalodes CBS 100304]|uniref:Uncharacterized protein n=1 Tax=Pyronema omphalodes (strain CBS 100304) TaxID=1076935 RepID=U4LPJ4_PYROM|nr:Protein of unknown function [Pyronema omphalodes CBS 100304]
MATNNKSSLNCATVPASANKSRHPSVATSCKICCRSPFQWWETPSFENVYQCIGKMLDCGHGNIQRNAHLKLYGISINLNDNPGVSQQLIAENATNVKAWQILYQMSDLTQNYNLTNDNLYTVPALKQFQHALHQHMLAFDKHDMHDPGSIRTEDIHCFMVTLQKRDPQTELFWTDDHPAGQVFCGMFQTLLVRSFKPVYDITPEFKLIMPVIKLLNNAVLRYIKHRESDEENLIAAEQH